MSKSQSTRVYLYEAASIILSAIIFGTIIGVVVSTTLILQFNVFSELPYQSTFPTFLYLIMCISGFVLGLLGSYFPTFFVNTLPLVKILKGLFE
jgi:ABC-type antimicrobial peptide transport system permease subunit